MPHTRPPASSSRFITRRSATGLTQKTRTASAAQHADAGVDAAADLVEQFGQHRERLVLVGAEMDRQHLGDQHFQGRQGARIGGEDQLPQLARAAAHLVGPGDAGRRAARRSAAAPAYALQAPAARARVPTRDEGDLRGGRRKPPGSSTAASPGSGRRRCGISHHRIGKPSDSSRWAMAEKSSQVAPTLHVSRPGIGKSIPAHERAEHRPHRAERVVDAQRVGDLQQPRRCAPSRREATTRRRDRRPRGCRSE